MPLIILRLSKFLLKIWVFVDDVDAKRHVVGVTHFNNIHVRSLPLDTCIHAI